MILFEYCHKVTKSSGVLLKKPEDKARRCWMLHTRVATSTISGVRNIKKAFGCSYRVVCNAATGLAMSYWMIQMKLLQFLAGDAMRNNTENSFCIEHLMFDETQVSVLLISFDSLPPHSNQASLWTVALSCFCFGARVSTNAMHDWTFLMVAAFPPLPPPPKSRFVVA